MSHLSSIILLSLLVVATAANPILQSHDDWLYPSGSNDISNADILATTTLHDISEHSANQEADLSLSKISEVLYDTNTLPDDLHNSARTAIIISTNDLGCSTGVEISKTEAKPDAFCRNDRVQLKDPDCDAIDGEGRSPYCCEGGHKEYAEVRKRCMDYHADLALCRDSSGWSCCISSMGLLPAFKGQLKTAFKCWSYFPDRY